MENPQLTIEKDHHGVWVWKTDFFPSYSVLAGQLRRRRIEHFDSISAAQKSYPTANVMDGRPLRDASAMSSQAPAWFDPSSAGETW